MKRVWACVIVSALCSVIALSASRRQDTSRAVFRTESNLVVLHVNVFDGRSDAVPDLPQSAFMVVEDDKPQEITFFSSADVPVAVGLVLDNSASMISRRGMVVTGSTAFAESSHPEDELFAVVFNENIRYGLPPGISFTTNRTLLKGAIARFPPGGKTAVYDAIVSALDHLEKSSHQKRVLVVLSDGDDNASNYTEEEMIDRARRSDAIIYTVSSDDFGSGRRSNPGVLRKLADTTGGLAYFPSNDEEVVAAFNTIAANIRRGYSIGYVPSQVSRNAVYHKVKVMVRVRGRNNLTVRSRHGYATPASSSTN
jgi:VWFA-related protein